METLSQERNTIMALRVKVTDTDINTHEQKSQESYLKRHWSINARKPLNYTLGTKLLSALTQSIAPAIRAAA